MASAVNWAILIVGLVTLVIVGLEFYLNHLREKRSDIIIEPLDVHDSSFQAPGSEQRSINHHLKITNEGERPAVLATHEIKKITLLNQEPQILTDLEDFDIGVASNYRELKNNSHVPGGFSGRFSPRSKIRRADLLDEFADGCEEIVFELEFTVEDNAGTYTVSTEDRMDYD